MFQKARVAIVATILALVLVACVERKAAPIALTDITSHGNEIGGYQDLPAHLDAQQYAEDMGVPLDEAMRRLHYQDEIGELNAALTGNERDTFAGLWIQHQPDFRVIVRFTRGGKRTIRPYIKDKSWANLVEVRQANVTLAELEVIFAETWQALDALDFEVSCTLDVQGNRIAVWVTDREWFEDELRKAAIRLPDHVELVTVEGQSARGVDVCAPSPVPGVAFPRQAPVEGPRATMAAEMIGELVLVDGYLRVESIYGHTSYLLVWPPEYVLRAKDDEIQVLDGDGLVVARVGEEVYMDGGEGSASAIAECVRKQLPSDATGPYWIVGAEVRPNLKRDSDLFALDVISTTERSFLLFRAKPALDGWGEQGEPLTGKLVLYDHDRCLRVNREQATYTLLWPSGYRAHTEGDEIEIVAGAGQVVARVGEEVRLDGRGIPVKWDSDQYRQLLHELPGDCNGPYWIASD